MQSRLEPSTTAHSASPSTPIFATSRADLPRSVGSRIQAILDDGSSSLLTLTAAAPGASGYIKATWQNGDGHTYSDVEIASWRLVSYANSEAGRIERTYRETLAESTLAALRARDTAADLVNHMGLVGAKMRASTFWRPEEQTTLTCPDGMGGSFNVTVREASGCPEIQVEGTPPSVRADVEAVVERVRQNAELILQWRATWSEADRLHAAASEVLSEYRGAAGHTL